MLRLFINRIKEYLKEAFNKLLNTFFYISYPKSDYILVNSWNYVVKGKLKHRNLGDELNVYLLNALTGKQILCYNSFFHRKKQNYMVIGSVIENFTDNKTIIWGSGAIGDKNCVLKEKPDKVYAVRGKLTRNLLLNYGVDCPEVYGDPALLLPLIYRPLINKKWKYGIIPHIYDLNHPVLDIYRNDPKCKIIRLDKYDDWHSIIDEICQCEFIFSSSLHGLILADAYNIPNMWISVYDKLYGGHFKFYDYFSGVGRNDLHPLPIIEQPDLLSISKSNLRDYIRIDFNVDKFLKSCPFRLTEGI